MLLGACLVELFWREMDGYEDLIKLNKESIAEKINKVVDSFKDISKVKFIINTRDFVDNGVLLCETDSKDLGLQNKIKEFFKNNFKLNIDISLVKRGEILNDGLVIEDKRELD